MQLSHVLYLEKADLKILFILMTVKSPFLMQ
jgi:hypothetical protein